MASWRTSWIDAQQDATPKGKNQFLLPILIPPSAPYSSVIWGWYGRPISGKTTKWTGVEIREYGHGDQLRWPRDTLYPQKLALTSPTSGGRSVGIIRSRTETTELV
jgi:hypothetical protein